MLLHDTYLLYPITLHSLSWPYLVTKYFLTLQRLYSKSSIIRHPIQKSWWFEIFSWGTILDFIDNIEKNFRKTTEIYWKINKSGALNCQILHQHQDKIHSVHSMFAQLAVHYTVVSRTCLVLSIFFDHNGSYCII